ncbi:MAG: chemotaxis protein CheW [Negativicutes bacterium]|nr:chemotaxis protein CheW [Negativicutes bacterium]
MGNDNDLLIEFVLEAEAHTAAMEAGLLRMEEGESDDDTINGIFRAAHSIKGTASFFGLSKIVELSHSIETLFGEFREHRLEASPEMIDILLSASDMLKGLIRNPGDSENQDITEHVAAIKRFLNDSQQQPAAQPATSAGALSAWDLWNQLTSADEPAEEAPSPVAPECFANKPEQSAPKDGEVVMSVGHQPERESKFREVLMEDSVRVNVGLLNDLLNLAGEMVLRRNQLLRVAQDGDKQSLPMEVIANGIDELTTNLQKKVMKTRMQPIANVFNKFPRIVRDLSRKVGKEVDLEMQGMSVELDRSLIEALVDPMTHLVRNALDHGIETPEIRVMNNKPLAGSLVLRAYHEGGRVIVDVCDDGAGIDLEKVKAKALQKGLVAEKDIAVMREADILSLILSPGFSTADRVTDLSGRGVGMDVVKTNIEKLGGKIEIFSDSGAGTTFRLIVPLTLAIISSLIVIVDDQAFAIPQANVRELLLIQPGGASEKRIEMVQGRPVLRLRGRLLPLIILGEMLNPESTPGMKAPSAPIADQLLRVLIVKAGNLAYGLVVDSVYDTEEILVKPLSPVLGSCGLYSGVTVLGDGSIAMILDTESIRRRAGLLHEEDVSQAIEVQGTKNIDQEKQYMLLFRSSGGEMLGLDLAMVSRVEEVDLSRLQKIGAKYYISFQGQTTRVIRPEHHLPLARRKNTLSKVYIIIPKLVKYPIGIIAEEIHDAIYTTVVLDQGGVAGKGILGSALIDGTVVTLLNMHELFAEAAPEYYTRLSARKKTGGETPAGSTPENSRVTILLVEDMPFFLKVVKSYLESDGYFVITAENGREALEILTRQMVDVVVSDIEMPLMTGIELVRAIRASDTLRHLPVIALTSLTGEVNKEKGLRAGFDLYEYKLHRTRLLESVSEVLHKRA